MAAAALLDRLDRVRQTAPGRWSAACPAHRDRSPSLSVRELEDGKVLVNCFAGCGAIDVLDALGLDWSALFPPNTRASAPVRTRIPPADLLTIIDQEVLTAVLMITFVVEQGGICTASQLERLTQAAARIGKARDHACPATVHPNHTKFPAYGR